MTPLLAFAGINVPMTIVEKIGRYRLSARIGCGGMGEVWRAWDSDLLRDVAIKRLARPRAHSSASLHQLREEARRACSLRHPAVVSVYDVIREGAETYLVEEFIEGVPLRQRLGPPMTLPEFLAVAVPVTDALAALARRGILHCDLKPENIMIDAGGQPRIVDFGLARLISRGGVVQGVADADDSSTPQLGGTPGYLAPEVIQGASPDARADVFGLGVVFYEMLLGEHPFAATTPWEGLELMLRRPPALPAERRPDLPADLSRLVSTMLAVDPARRPDAADVEAVLLAIEREVSPAGRLAPLPRIRTPWAPPPARPLLHLRPFTAATDEPAARLAAGALTAAVRARLAQVRGLDLVDPPHGAAPALEMVASVSIQEDRLRLTWSLLSPDSDQSLCEGSIEEATRHWLPVRDRLCAQVIRELSLRYTDALDADATTVSLGPMPGREEYLQGLAGLQMATQVEEREAAIALLERSVEADPQYAPALAALADAYARRYHSTRDAHWAERAEEEAHRALALAPLYPEVRHAVGEVHLTTGKAARALQVFQEILEEDPGNYTARIGLARAQAVSGRPEEAERNFLEAIRTQPDAWTAHNRLGEFYVRQGQCHAALRAFLRVVELAPGYAPGLSNVGAVYQYLGRKEEAIEAYRRSVAIHPNYPALSNMATLLRSEGRLEEAAATYEQALRQNDRDYRVWGNLGSTYDLLPGRAPDADRCFRRAVELAERQREVNPSDPAVLAHLAQYFGELGQKVVARRHIERALEIDGGRANLHFIAAAIFEDLGSPEDHERACHELIRALELGVPIAAVEGEPVLEPLCREPLVRAQILERRRQEQSEEREERASERFTNCAGAPAATPATRPKEDSMSTWLIEIDARGTAAVTPTPKLVKLHDAVRWTVKPETASATISFHYPNHVRMSGNTVTKLHPVECEVISAPRAGEDLGYDVSVTDPAWPQPKPATAELIIAVEKAQTKE